MLWEEQPKGSPREPSNSKTLLVFPISSTVPTVIVDVRMRHEKGSTLGPNRGLSCQGSICSSRGSAQVFRLDRKAVLTPFQK